MMIPFLNAVFNSFYEFIMSFGSHAAFPSQTLLRKDEES